jgi:hypothetical protein
VKIVAMLLLLEDNAERIERFAAVLRALEPPLPFQVWRNAWHMIRDMEVFLAQAHVLSLDHDLDPEEGDESDPGTGWDVTRYLAARKPACPVIIHTSNGERATWMEGEFERGGWIYQRVPPLGEDWIEHDWRQAVRRCLGRRGRRRGGQGR